MIAGLFCPFSNLPSAILLNKKVMSEISQKDIEFLFQEEVLDQHGEYLIDLLTETLQGKNIRVTDDLMEGLNYRMFREGENRGLRVNFFTYGRFIQLNIGY